MSVRHSEMQDRKVRYRLVLGIPFPYATHFSVVLPIFLSIYFPCHGRAALDKETFEAMWKDSEPGGALAGLFLRHTHTEFRADGIDPSPWLDYMPNYHTVPEHDLIPGSTAGYTFTTLALNPPAYVNWLLARFLCDGGSMKRVNLQHISQVLDNTTDPAAIIACPGIGARVLGGIEDKDVYPIRGQTLLLRAPWIKYGRTLSGADGSYVYMMPRCTGEVRLYPILSHRARNAQRHAKQVIVGGIKVPNDWQVFPLQGPQIHVSSTLGTQHHALRTEPTSSRMCSRSVPTLHPPLSVQTANRRLKTSKHSSSTKGAGYAPREREESGSRLITSNEEKEGRFHLSTTMGRLQLSTQSGICSSSWC
ncbi:hypothetical protein J3R82DRAFT_6631 [Butyriboletus roseoflavus]|nr:hypothetical protein J3R82DRAFT_6631 [Butyriboletus roseoflavus]